MRTIPICVRRFVCAVSAIFLVGSVWTVSASECASIPSPIVSWWRGESNAVDTISGNNGVLINNAGFAPGLVGTAFNFDGIATRIDLGDPDSLKFTNSFSIETWIWISGYPSERELGQILFRGDTRFSRDPYYLAITSTGRIRFHVESNGVTLTGGANLETDPVPVHEWLHVAAVYQVREIPMMLVYTNAQLAGQMLTGEVPYRDLIEGGGIAIGDVSPGSRGLPFYGLIDELAVYSDALSAAQIQDIYEASASGKCLSAPPPPQITSQPSNQTVLAGTSVTFTVGATGTGPLFYQWFFGSNSIAGQTSSSLTLTRVNPNQSGAYSVVISDVFNSETSANSVTSAPALLAVLPNPPRILVQPMSVTAYETQSATFRVWVQQPGQTSYQWFFEGMLLPGQTKSNLTLTNLQMTQAGRYWVTVSNTLGVGVSSNAILTILPKPICVPPPEGIVAWWRAESNRVDSVGVHDLARASSSLYSTGIVGTAFSVRTTGFVAAADDELDLGGGVGLSVEGWIRPTPGGAPISGPLIEWTNLRGNPGLALRLESGYRSIIAIFTDTNSSPIRTVALRTNLPVAEHPWRHVALTFDRVSGLATIYVDGKSVTQTNFGAFRPMTKTPVYVGTSAAGTFSGDMDEFALYNRALTAAEIQSIYDANFLGRCLPSAAPCLPVSDSVVAWWRAESNLVDAISGNTAVGSNGVFYTSGEVGTGFSFTSAGNYLRVPESSSLDVGTGEGLTIELWAKPQTTSAQPLVEWNSGTGVQGVYLSYNAGIEANIIDTSGNWHRFGTPSVYLGQGEWANLAVTYDHTSGFGVIYFSGVEVARTNLGIFTPRTALPLYLGYRPKGAGALPDTHFTGIMDEVSIYNRALTAAEIKSIVLARNKGKCSQPPVILVQPQDQVVNRGDTASFAVQADGTALHYQWFFEASSISNANAATLELTNVQPAQGGSYHVVVTNRFGSATSSNAVLRVNLLPVADASATPTLVISINGSNSPVAFDGSRSSDPDGDALQFSWYDAATLIATGAVTATTLPVGSNTITLTVTDGIGSSSQTIVVQVVTTAQAVQRLIDQVSASVAKPQPLTAMLSSALASIERGNLTAAINQLHAFQNKVLAQVAPTNPALAQMLITEAQAIIDALSGGSARIISFARHANGKVHLEFFTQSEKPWKVEESTDLTHWQPSTGKPIDLKNGRFGFDETNESPMRFYRVSKPAGP